MSAQTAPSKIIASPEALKAQSERINAALAERERSVTEKIVAILKEENCTLDTPIIISAISGIQPAGFRVVAIERLQQ